MSIVVAALMLPSVAAASSAEGALSPLLDELASPTVRSESPARQATVLGVPTAGPGSLQREGERVLVRVRFDRGAISRLPALSGAGGLVQTASRRYQTATVSALPSQLRVLAEVPGVVAVSAGRTPLLLQASTSVAGEPPCEGGAVITEGLKQLRVDLARETFGLRGKGITVGVLSDSFNRATKAVTGGPIATHAKEDIISGDLPGPAGSCSGQQAPVVVLEEGPASGSTDEGRAMLQIVHDVAPNAGLAFASAFKSEEAFAKNIERLALPVSAGGAGAKVIVDDVAYFEEPFFQDGPVAAAVNKVTAEGITYLTAAGNDNLFDASGNEIASWEAPEFRDAGSCPAAVGVAATHCMDFNPGAGSDTGFGITVEPGGTLIADLQWAEPWNGVKTDFDAYLLNKTGTEVLAKATENNIAAQKPVELIGWENKSPSSREVQLVINRCSGGCNPQASATAKPRLKFALLENGGGVEETEYAVSAGGDVVGPTIFGHAGAAAALSVGAIRYSTTSAPEEYSSRGPVTHYFGPVAGAEAAAPLGAPEPIEKPDFVATDCGATTFFARFQEGAWRFCGTSAAAPHAAGIAALLAEGKPGATPPEIRSALDASAVPVGSYPPEAIGAGLLQADGALTQLGVIPGSEDGPGTIVPPLESEPGTAVVQPPVPNPTPSAPTTRFTKHPAKTVRTRGRTARVVFRFGSDQPGVTFLCRIDGAAFRGCPAKLVRRFALGRHTLRVKARNAAGRTDATPAVFRFRVERIA